MAETAHFDGGMESTRSEKRGGSDVIRGLGRVRTEALGDCSEEE